MQFSRTPCLISMLNFKFLEVERVGLHLQSLENRFVALEGKDDNIEEKDLAHHHVEELHGTVRQGKKEHGNDISFFRSQLCASNQILLKKENQVTKEELEEEHYKTVKNEIDNIIMNRFLVELTEKNLFLSKECRNYMDKLKHAEKFIFELKQEWASQERKLVSLSDRNVKLLEGIHVMMKTYDTKKSWESSEAKKDCEISNDGYDNILQIILNKIAELQGTVSVTKGEIHHFQLEKPCYFTLLEQLALILAELRAQKKVLEQESLLRNQEIVNFQRKNHELMVINEQSWKDINAGKQREEMLNVEMERMCGRLSDLQETCVSHSEILKLRLENESLSQKLYKLAEKNDALEEANYAILEKAISQEHFSLIFRSCNAEKLLENKIHQGRNAFRRLNLDTEAGTKHLKQRDMELFITGKEFQGIQSPELPLNPEGFIMVINKAKMDRDGLEKIFFSLLEENSFKDHEIGCLRKSNEMLEDELYKLHKIVESHRTVEKKLTSELQISIDECRSYKAEAMNWIHDLHVSSIMELIFKEKFFELMQILKGLETIDIVKMNTPVEEIALRNVQDKDLREKLDVLGRENKGLKAELNAYSPLVVSLENEIASLEEHTLSLTNLHILNSKRKQESILTSLQPKKCSQVRGKHHSPRASAGIMVLKKLRTKVKVLQKAVTDTEGLLEQGKVVSGTNVDGETRKVKACKSNGSARLVGAQKKKDIILDLLKSEDTGNDVKLLKDGIFYRVKHEQVMKDIELDHVLSTSRCEADFIVETDDHTCNVWEPTTLNNKERYQIGNMEVEKSENPSSELVLEKELSFDKIVLPSNYDESLQEWVDRISGSLSGDAQRLLSLEKILEELKKKIETSEMRSQPSALELNTVKLHVKESEDALMKLIDFNCKLTKMAETFSLSSDSNTRRRKALERVQRGAEKIDGLELKLQKVQCILLKLLEEQLESKAVKPLERRSRIPLKDLIYGKRSDSKQMKRRFCACMRLKTMEK